MKKPDGSWEKFDDYVVDFALEAAKAGKRLALVTLVLIDGASPRMLGAQMAVDEDGEWVGYLSGGCVERVIVTEAQVAQLDPHAHDDRLNQISFGLPGVSDPNLNPSMPQRAMP